MHPPLTPFTRCVPPPPLDFVDTQATFLETGDGLEGFVQLAGTGSWVSSRRGQKNGMIRLPAFPHVDKTPRKFVVSARDGVQTVVGPSYLAPPTGQLLPFGTEGRSEMVWSVEGWPGDRGTGDIKFVLLEGMGWVQLDAGGEGLLQEVNADAAPQLPSPPGAADGGEEQKRQENGSATTRS